MKDFFCLIKPINIIYFFRFLKPCLVWLCLVGLGYSTPLVTASPSIRSNLRQFYLYINKGDYNQAAKTIEQLSDSSMKVALSADLAYYQGQYDEAIVLYEEASDSLNSQKILLNWSKALYQRGRFYEKLNVDGTNSDLIQLAQTDFSLASSKVVQLLQNENSSHYLSAWLLAAKLNKTSPLTTKSLTIDLEVIENNILSLPDSQKKIRLLLELAEISPQSEIWEKALSLAKQLDNLPYQSLAQGNLGEHYLQQNNPQAALKAAWSAQLAASKIHDWQSLIQWHYLAARAFEQLENQDSAITQYKLAVATIKKLRQQLSGNPISPHLYFDVVKPVLNDYLQLLFSLPSPPLEEVISLQQLDQLGQLDNYFRVICQLDLETPQKMIEKTSARIFFIELDQSIHAVVQLSDSLLHYPLTISHKQLQAQVKQWRVQLMNAEFEESFELGSILYKTILAPLMPTLEAKQIEHLQFISNGVLRTVPLAALNDGEKYLIEQFALSYSLGLGNQVTPKLQRDFLPLIAGLTRSTSKFPNPLKFAEKEALQVQTLLGGTILLDDTFSAISLALQLQDDSYQILHLATHASFSFVRDRAFIETGTQTISLNQFESILKQRRSPLQLLVLSACQTAVGDRYSALGLLGVGLRNNIDVVVGSFWEVGDSSTSEQMKTLYELWKQGASLPEALRQVQLGLIRDGELPADWASFIVAFN